MTRVMKSPTIPTTLTTIPPEILDEITYWTMLPTLGGPPTNLIPLLLVCKQIHETITTSVCLYARVFRTQFDSAALWRRFPADWLTTHILANELQRRWKALKRIRRLASQWRTQAEEEPWLTPVTPDPFSAGQSTQDLWTIYFMLLENDGTNERQLCWAGASNYINAYIATALIPRARRLGFQPETVEATLTLSCLWLLTDQTSLASESAVYSESIVGLIRPFVFGAHRYDACFAPWPEFDLPLTPPNAPSRPRLPTRYRMEPHTPYMATDQTLRDNGQQVDYLDQKAIMSAPLMGPAAMFSFFARIEVRMSGSRPRLHDTVIHQPATGAGPGPLHRGATATVTAPPVNGQDDLAGIIERYPTSGNSKIYDLDFHRLVACVDPYVPSFEGPRPFYPPGTLAGVWEGRFAYLEFDAFRDMLVGYNPQELVQEHELLMGQQHQVWRTKEFHLYASAAEEYLRRAPAESDRPTSAAFDSDPTSAILSTGPAMNAFFPEKTVLKEVHGGLEVYEPGRHGALFYKEYTTSTTTKCRESATKPKPTTEPEEEDRILDTIVTGSGHSAWGPFSIRGRIRAWDGLITISKDYSGTTDRPGDTETHNDSEEAHDRGRWLYRGYLYAGGDHWVGRWRDTVTELQFCGYEGAFILHARR